MRYKIQTMLLLPEGWTTAAVIAITTAGYLHLEPPRNVVDVLLLSTLFVAPVGALCAVGGIGMTMWHWHRDREERWFLLGHGLMGGCCALACLFWLNWEGIKLM